jgi:osmotically-inducible protein OsmY
MEGNPYASDPRDVELEHEVGQHLHNIGVERYHVSVRGGHVTVSGTVDDFSTKREVTQRIQSLGGITQVTNNIRVGGDFSMHYGGDRS